MLQKRQEVSILNPSKSLLFLEITDPAFQINAQNSIYVGKQDGVILHPKDKHQKIMVGRDFSDYILQMSDFKEDVISVDIHDLKAKDKLQLAYKFQNKQENMFFPQGLQVTSSDNQVEGVLKFENNNVVQIPVQKGYDYVLLNFYLDSEKEKEFQVKIVDGKYTDQGGSGNLVWMIVGIVIFVIMLMGVILFIMYYKKKKQQQKEHNYQNLEYTTP